MRWLFSAGPSHASPSPTNTSAKWASGARSPEAPTEPWSGTIGVTSRSSNKSRDSTSSGRQPECPRASDAARNRIMARATSREARRPTPAACERSRLS